VALLAFLLALACLDLFPRLLPAAYAQAPLKIMPLGDSITAGDRNGGYRRLLYELLSQDGISFEFVGSLKSGDVPDAHHEGHSGWRIDQIEDGIARGWLETYKPDLVLLHIGTNDVWQHKSASASVRLSQLIDDILSRSPTTQIIVAQILPMTNDANSEAEVMKYSAAIPDILTSKTSPVCMVNMHESFSAGDLVHGVHPNKSGYDKMARIWEPAIRAMVEGSRRSDASYHCGHAHSFFKGAHQFVWVEPPSIAASARVQHEDDGAQRTQ
jgi:lysophospholipase L1-like esterase